MRGIQVLMSTYNGENYLESQIESILNQKNVDVFLAIRDDGSTDQTLTILEKYKDIKNVEIYKGRNLGYAKSFLWLLNEYKDKAKYFAFSDQDDYWLSEKLSSAIEIIESSQSENSQLYFSNLIATDEKLNPIRTKQFNDRLISLGSSLSRSNIAGCTMVFNQKLALKVSKIPVSLIRQRGHDSWVQNVCLAINGKIHYDENSYILFRRHGSTTSDMNRNAVYKIKNELAKLKKSPNLSYAQAEILKIYFYNDFSEENRKLIEDIINYQQSIYKKIKLLRNSNIKSNNFALDFYTKIKILFGKY